MLEFQQKIYCLAKEGFEIAQGRLGLQDTPLYENYWSSRKSFGMMSKIKITYCFWQSYIEQLLWYDRIAESRILINQSRLLTLNPHI